MPDPSWSVGASIKMPTYAEQHEAMLKEAALPLSERLKRAADNETRRGDQYKGCSWMGSEHPSAHHYQQASLLMQASLLALQNEQRSAKRRKSSAKPASQVLRDELPPPLSEEGS